MDHSSTAPEWGASFKVMAGNVLATQMLLRHYGVKADSLCSHLLLHSLVQAWCRSSCPGRKAATGTEWDVKVCLPLGSRSSEEHRSTGLPCIAAAPCLSPCRAEPRSAELRGCHENHSNPADPGPQHSPRWSWGSCCVRGQGSTLWGSAGLADVSGRTSMARDLKISQDARTAKQDA